MEKREYNIVISSKKHILWLIYILAVVGLILFVFSLNNSIGVFISIFFELILIFLIIRMKVKFLNKQEIILRDENGKLAFICCDKKIEVNGNQLDLDIKSRFPFFKIRITDRKYNQPILNEDEILFTKDELINLISILSKFKLIHKNVELQKIEKNINFSYRPEDKIFIFKGKVYNISDIKDVNLTGVKNYTNGMYMHTKWFLKIELKNGEILETELFGNEIGQALKLERDFYKVDEEFLLTPHKPDLGIPSGVFLFIAGLILLFIASKLSYTPRQWVGIIGLILTFFGGLGTILYIFNAISLLILYKFLKNKLKD